MIIQKHEWKAFLELKTRKMKYDQIFLNQSIIQVTKVCKMIFGNEMNALIINQIYNE